MARRTHVSYATPHNHHAMQTQITMRDLRRHLIEDHSLDVIAVTDFSVLVKLHMNGHNGAAPQYTEQPMNAQPPF